MSQSEAFEISLESLKLGYPQKGMSGWSSDFEISLNIQAPAFICLIGPNGAGKSTLLKTLGGFIEPISGKIAYNGTNIHDLSYKRLATQRSFLKAESWRPAWTQAYDWVAQGRSPYLGWSGKLTKKDHKVIDESLELVNAAHLKAVEVDSCSDGEFQRLNIARSLSQQCPLLLLDEAMAHLDVTQRVEIISRLKDYTRAQNRITIISIHDLALAFEYADQIFCVQQPSIFECGTADELIQRNCISQVFDSEAVKFDVESGQFRHIQ